MPVNLAAVDPVILSLIAAAAAILLTLLVFIAVTKYRAKREKKTIRTIRATVIEYFQRSGVAVTVGCTRLPGEQFYTAFIESEPMKRFRLSHIIEATLRDHLQKNCGMMLGKIYWRFPIKPAPGNAADAAKDKKTPEEAEDDYINEGLVHYKHLPKVEVTETSWATFEEVSVAGAKNTGPEGES